MRTAPKDTNRPEAFDGASLVAASRAMAGDILPNDPVECRRRDRMYALRAMERLGLLDGGESLIPTLAARPALRWLVDEEGARMGILTELGRIRDRAVFEAAVGWVLRDRPNTDEARAGLRRLRACAIGPSPRLSSRRFEGPDLGGRGRSEP